MALSKTRLQADFDVPFPARKQAILTMISSYF